MNHITTIPETIRADLEPMSVIDEHPEFFARPTRPVLGSDYEIRIDAVQRIGREPADVISRNPAFGFALEAQLDDLEEVLDRLQQAHPASFREIERGRDLVENLQIMIAGGPSR